MIPLFRAFAAFLLALLLLSLLSCQSKLYVIERGCIKDDFTIRLPQQNTELKPNEFFNIAKLGLRVNSNLMNATNTDFLQAYKLGKTNIVSYPIQIVKDRKTWYGRLAFFGVEQSAQTQAVATFYKIAIPEDYFSQAVDGRTACVYEYYDLPAKRNEKNRFPTWVIWMSDIEI